MPLAHASWKERRSLTAALRAIYQAPTEAAAASALDAFEAGPRGEKYPGVVRGWRSVWEQVVPFFAFSVPIRRAIYTTNAIESLNSSVRTRGHCPNDRAATKLIYLALQGVSGSGGHRRRSGTLRDRLGRASIAARCYPRQSLSLPGSSPGAM